MPVLRQIIFLASLKFLILSFAKINIYRALKTILSKIFIFIILAVATVEAYAQHTSVRMVPSGTNAEKVITSDNIRMQVEFLTDTTFKGRATGSRGAAEVALWISRRYESAGLTPFGGTWSRSFKVGDVVGRNILGFLPGKREASKEMYVIVCAHYDSHGIIDGNFYPGADNNASGVAAMLSVAEMFNRMKQLGRSYGKNLIFVATDAKEQNSAGAEALMEDIKNGNLKDPVNGETITIDRIHSTVVLDILGSTLAPIHKDRKDFLIMLSGGQYTFDLTRANEGKGLGLDIATSYYGSKSFTEMFHSRFGDQKIFVQNGLTCVVFTSGITMLTNKTGDTADTLDYDVLRKRIFLIFHWLEKVL